MFHRLFAIVLFTTLLLCTILAENLSAQGRGGGGRAFGSGRGMATPGAASRPAFVFHPSQPVGRPFVGGPRFDGFHRQRTVIVAEPFIGGYSPYYSPYFLGTPLYTPPAYPEPTYYTAPVNQNEIDLANEVRRLTEEVERLRQEQALAASRQSLSVSPPSVPGPPPIPTTLVFRDGRRMMIENYAIVGESIWILDEKSSARISLAELDLDATQRENSSKGVRFLVPQR